MPEYLFTNRQSQTYQSPSKLAKAISHYKWQMPRHLKLIENALILLTKRKIRKLIVNLPPRHGKSELISKFYPLWYLNRYPNHRIMLISYNASFAKYWSRIVRDLISEFSETLLNISLSKTNKSSESFALYNAKGGMYAIGAGGSITGRGADLIIIDDPIKNDTQANSAYFRDKIWDWFNSTVFTRLEPDGIIILVMTRWNEDDICGRLIKNQLTIEIKGFSHLNELKKSIPWQYKLLSKAKWWLIKIPAIANDNDILQRKDGEELWQERFDKEKLFEIKQQIGNYWFSALYQQEPMPQGKGIFERKYFKYFEVYEDYYKLFDNNGRIELRAKANCTYFITADLAVSEKDLADYTVFIISALTEKKEILIIDVIRERIKPLEHLAMLKNLARQWLPALIGIESVQYQSSLVQSALSEGLPVKSLRPDNDKISRAIAISAKVELGIVYFRQNANWLYEFESELTSFPDGKYDDQVDALAYIARILEYFSDTKPTSTNLKHRSVKNIISKF